MEIRALDNDPTVREAEVLNKDRLPGARWGLALALASLFWLARHYRRCASAELSILDVPCVLAGCKAIVRT